MIEINLIEKRKKRQLPIILGMDLNKVNWKFVAIASLLLYVPDWYVKPMFKDDSRVIDQRLKSLDRKVKDVEAKINQNKNVKDKLRAFNRQIEKLEERSKQVQKIISQKTNPKRVLEGLARSAPTDLWFNELSIDDNSKLLIKGGSETYKSIGDFIIAANDTPFFGKSLVLTDSQTKQIEVNGTNVRVERFEIKGNVVTYDPFE